MCQISSYITENCFKTAIKLHLDCKKALATGALPRTPLGELPLTPDPLPCRLAPSAFGRAFLIKRSFSSSTMKIIPTEMKKFYFGTLLTVRTQYTKNRPQCHSCSSSPRLKQSQRDETLNTNFQSSLDDVLI